MNEINLGGNVFTVVPLPAMRAFALQPKIIPVVAEVFSLLAGLTEGAAEGATSLSLGDLEVSKITPYIDKIAAKLQPEILEELIKKLLLGATMDGTQLFTAEGNPFDVKMRGRTLDIWKLLWHAIRVNYPDFFGMLPAVSASSVGVKGSAA